MSLLQQKSALQWISWLPGSSKNMPTCWIVSDMHHESIGGLVAEDKIWFCSSKHDNNLRSLQDYKEEESLECTPKRVQIMWNTWDLKYATFDKHVLPPWMPVLTHESWYTTLTFCFCKDQKQPSRWWFILKHSTIMFWKEFVKINMVNTPDMGEDNVFCCALF